jgi:DNA-binding transcriptional MerR regulator/methylmalonyl-CoA mutase cobalamin-binding subunit
VVRDARSTSEPTGTLLSIGDVAEATGISPDTIRVWERRYGRPVPVRLPSGHRRYTPDHVRWLRRVAEALSRGHRPSAAVRASERDLEAMLAPDQEEQARTREIERLLELVRGFRQIELNRGLRAQYRKLGPQRFLEERVGPLLTAVGRAWADGELDVGHEHFASEVLEDLLRNFRNEQSVRGDSPLVLLATLPDEDHDLGLQMAALLCSVQGTATRILGRKTPLEDIARSARDTAAAAVAISVSLATGGIETDRRLAELRRMLPAEVGLVIGGRGARGVRRGPRGVTYVDGLEGLEAWLETL